LKAPVTVAAGTIPAAELPLILEDKTFVPANIAQQDALWDSVAWGATGDLWFPHVYEPNQDPTQSSGANPVGRWDYGPLFWPIFTVHPLKAVLPSPSFVPESYMDTPLVNGTAYPKVTVEPKAYRVRLLNGSNDRYYNLGLYVADPTPTAAPLLDAYGNPVVDKLGNQQYLTNTEVKMVAAAAVDTAGHPQGWDPVAGVQLPLAQFPAINAVTGWHVHAEPSGPSRAWPIDGRIGGAPDPTTSGPDFVVIGNDGGLLPQASDIPSQPITYEVNRRSITILNAYGYGLLVGPSERADTIVDFSAYAGKTLILYNDAPAPFPFNDNRNDYFTGDPDFSASGGAYSTLPGYGPNTRTIMQITVGNIGSVTSGGPLNAAALVAALPAAYAASQPAPIVPETAYNAAFGTSDTDNYGRVATGSNAQPNLVVTHTGGLVLTGFSIITSGGTNAGGGAMGSGSGYLIAPQVVISGGGGTGASACATLNPQGQVASVSFDPAVCPSGSVGSGYTSAPTVTFIPSNGPSGITVNDGGQGYTNPVTVTLTGGGLAAPTVVPATVTLSTGSSITTGTFAVANGGSGYLVPPTVAFTGGGSGALGTATISSSPLILGTATVATAGSNYTSPTVNVSAPQLAGGVKATASASVGFAISPFTSKSFTAGTGLDPSTAYVTLSAPNLTGGKQALATVTVDSNLANATYGQVTAVTLDPLNPGSGYTAAPTVAITDINGNQTATATATLAAGSGQVFGVSVLTAGSGYTVPATITFTDATGSGALASAALAGPAGSVTSLAITGGGGAYTNTNLGAVFTDVTAVSPTHAAATPAQFTPTLVSAIGAITGVTLPANLGLNLTSAPAVGFTSAAAGGAGALATAGIAAVGVGAQALVTTSTSASIPVLTKAEQELYDDWGRYNSTGGSELPFTTAAVQTTIPLNYIDQPTEILGDDELQIWKLVDNGFWSNSIHFSGWDVQLLNRVGWDGTVKPPATEELGWKDTVRLNPLEDVMVALRAKAPNVNFGQPRSTRLLDPSKPSGTGNFPIAPGLPVAGTQYASGLGFTADPNVVTLGNTMNSAIVGVGTVLLASSTNTALLAGSTTGNFDNEFVWGSAILGHTTNDFTRPVVFNPVVTKPDQPVVLADTLGTGKLTWVDPTPVGQLANAAAVPPLAATLANPKNEIGFKVLQAPITDLNKYTVGAWTPTATPFDKVPANTLNYAEPAALVAPNLPTYYAYEVVAYNAAGDSTPSNVWYETPPAAPTLNNLTPLLTPSFITPATTTSDVKLTLNWIDNAVNETNFVITKTGGPGAVLANGKVTGGTVTTLITPPNALPISAPTTFVDPAPLVEGAAYEYDIIATNKFGNSTPVLTGTITAPISAPIAPTNLAYLQVVASCPIDALTKLVVPTKCRPDFVNLTWTDNAFNEIRYDVLRNGSVIGSLASPAIVNGSNGTGTLTYVDQTALEGVPYVYTVNAVNTAGTAQAVTAAGVATTLAVTEPNTAPTVPSNVVVTPSTTVDANGTYVDTSTITWSDNAYNEAGYQITRTITAPANLAASPAMVFNVAGSAVNDKTGTGTTGWSSSPVLTFNDTTGLIDGATYQYSIAGVNAVAPTGGPAAVATKAMPGIVINPPSTLVVTPNRAGSSIGLQWTDNSTNETDFLVEESSSTTGGLPANQTVWTALPPIARSTTLPNSTGGLVNYARANVPTTTGLVYSFRISARNLANKSDSHPYLYGQASLQAPVFTYASTLAAPTVSATGRVGLSWTAVPAASIPAGTTISYQVNITTGGITTTVRTNATTYNYRPTLAQLQAGITYTVQAVATAIRVANPTVFGATTAPVSNAQTVLVGIPAVMAAPTASAPVAAGGGNYTSNLKWPVVTGATGYVITPTLNGVAQAVINIGNGATVTRAVTLVAGNTYTYTIAATNLAGTGTASPAVTVNTPAAANAAVVAAAGGTPGSGIMVNWTNTSVNLTATPFTVQRRTVTAGNAAGAWVTITPTITTNGTAYAFTDTSALKGTGYSYHILANGAGGASAYSTATTPRAVAP
jgi:hypothetical protein